MDFASKNLTAGQLDAIVRKLGGEEAALRFLRGDQHTEETHAPTLTTWKTITLGAHATMESFMAALSPDTYKISPYALELLNSPDFVVASELIEADLVILSVQELGFQQHATYAEICAKATGLSLELCPAEVGPLLRVAHDEQCRGESLRTAMEPLTASDGYQVIFELGHDATGKWLHVCRGCPTVTWDLLARFVFVLPSK